MLALLIGLLLLVHEQFGGRWARILVLHDLLLQISLRFEKRSNPSPNPFTTLSHLLDLDWIILRGPLFCIILTNWLLLYRSRNRWSFLTWNCATTFYLHILSKFRWAGPSTILLLHRRRRTIFGTPLPIINKLAELLLLGGVVLMIEQFLHLSVLLARHIVQKLQLVFILHLLHVYSMIMMIKIVILVRITLTLPLLMLQGRVHGRLRFGSILGDTCAATCVGRRQPRMIWLHRHLHLHIALATMNQTVRICGTCRNDLGRNGVVLVLVGIGYCRRSLTRLRGSLHTRLTLWLLVDSRLCGIGGGMISLVRVMVRMSILIF